MEDNNQYFTILDLFIYLLPYYIYKVNLKPYQDLNNVTSAWHTVFSIVYNHSSQEQI